MGRKKEEKGGDTYPEGGGCHTHLISREKRWWIKQKSCRYAQKGGGRRGERERGSPSLKKVILYTRF